MGVLYLLADSNLATEEEVNFHLALADLSPFLSFLLAHDSFAFFYLHATRTHTSPSVSFLLPSLPPLVSSWFPPVEAGNLPTILVVLPHVAFVDAGPVT